MSQETETTLAEDNQEVESQPRWTVVPPGSPTLEERVKAIEDWVDWLQNIHNDQADESAAAKAQYEEWKAAGLVP